MTTSVCPTPYLLPIRDQPLLKKQKIDETTTQRDSTKEKIKKVTFGDNLNCYFFSNTPSCLFALKAKHLTGNSKIIFQAFEPTDLERYNPMISCMSARENSLFSPIKSLLKESIPLSRKQYLIEMMFLKLYLKSEITEKLKSLRNYNVIDKYDNDWMQAWVEAIVLNLSLEFNDKRKVLIALDWLERLLPDIFLTELKKNLMYIAESIPYFFNQALRKSQSMIDLTQADHNQISASNASCFWIRFLSLNPYYLSHIDALFNLHPQFLKIIHEELKVLALSNAVDLSLEFRLNVQINAFHEKFYDFCQIATIEELKDFFNHCLMTDIYLANLFPLGLDFASVLNNLEQIHQGPQGAFIVNLILAEHPKFIHLKERLHIDYALSKLSHLKQDLSQSEFIENIKIQLSNFPVKKKQYLGSSISFIDVDLLVDWLTKKCPENRSLQSLYFWKTLFSLYPHYKNYETIKQLFLIYNEESKGILKNYLDSLNVSP